MVHLPPFSLGRAQYYGHEHILPISVQNGRKNYNSSNNIVESEVKQDSGHAVAQVVSHRLPTATQVGFWVRSCGICDGQSGTEAGFLQVLQFNLQSITLTAPHSSSIIIWSLYNRPVVASVPLHPKLGGGNLTACMIIYIWVTSNPNCISPLPFGLCCIKSEYVNFLNHSEKTHFLSYKFICTAGP
jgi:hypothetical protein